MPKDFSGFLHTLFLSHAPEVGAFVRGRWPKEPDVGDIVQESFLRLSQYPEPDAIQNPRAFLFQTAANLTVDRHRRRETRARFADADAEIDDIATTAALRSNTGRPSSNWSGFPSGWPNCRNCAATPSCCTGSKVAPTPKSRLGSVSRCAVPSVT